jgi:thiol-disulfide isomerase/thioredoxin
MKKVFSLLLVAVVANAVAQSGRKNVRPPTQSLPPVQAPVWTPPDPDPRPVAELGARLGLRVLPDSVRERSLRALDDGSFRLADFGGKIVVVNLWASWCGPCRREVPEYEKVRKDYAGRNVEFIGLTIENPNKSAARVREFVRNLKFGFRLGWADPETADTLMHGYEGIPQTLVIAPDGHVLDHWDGYARTHSGDHLRATIERALSGNSGQ